MHEWGSTRRGEMVLFGAISITSVMVVRVFWRVRERFCCRGYVKSGTNKWELK